MPVLLACRRLTPLVIICLFAGALLPIRHVDAAATRPAPATTGASFEPQAIAPATSWLRPAALQLQLVPVVDRLAAPTYVTHAGDGSGRLFVVEKRGTIKVARNGQTEIFLDIRPLVESTGPEQGLLGLAFHPQFADNGFFYVAYTGKDGTNTVARYRVAPGDPNRADPASGLTLLAIPDPAEGHNGGMLAFGPRDGYLYVGIGDGGVHFSEGDDRAQDKQALHGKLLRLDVDGGTPYAIPPGNPFVGQPGARGEIWAYGLRNPWRFSFDRVTNDLFIADVGQYTWEEVNRQPAGSAGGENYGWRVRDGFECFNAPTCATASFQDPIYAYGHEGGNCSITGGYVYRGAAAPLLQGAYLYADFCAGRIWALSQVAGRWVSTLLLDTDYFISSFGEDERGELYVVDIRGGRLYQLVATGSAQPNTIDGGHSDEGVAAPSTVWYFAEGSTMPGFDQYLSILNPNASDASVQLTYYLAAGPPVVKTLTAPANRRTTVAVHDPLLGIGRGHEVAVSVEVINNVPIVVERPIYFVYGSTIDGGHNVAGATALSTVWYFAEGSTMPGFDEYLSILNPGSTDADVTITYYLAGSEPVTKTLTAPASRRTTVTVYDARLGVGRDQQVAAKVESTNGVGLVVERPIYFTYGPNGVAGGHNVLGATAPRTAWYFAEGTTRDGFDEFLTMLNPSSAPAPVTLTYYLANGMSTTREITVPARTRYTVAVHGDAPEGLGRGQDVAVSVTTTNPDGLVVERPIYFTYGNAISGGHNVMGAAMPSTSRYFAEGSTAAGFDQFFTILNPQTSPAEVTITYYPRDAAPISKAVTIGPTSRYTIAAHDTALGVGREQEVAARVTTTHPGGIVVERPMYFRYR